MSKLEQARKTWVGKSDEWLYERLANELSDKVQEIHRLLKELDEVKNLTIPAVVGRSEQLKAFADYVQGRMWEGEDKDLSEFVEEFLSL